MGLGGAVDTVAPVVASPVVVATSGAWQAGTVLPVTVSWSAADERTGVAVGASPDDFVPVGGPIARNGRTLRYVTVAQLPDGLRLYFETQRADGANDLQTTFVLYE